MSNDLPTMPEECISAFVRISKLGQSQGYQPDDWKSEIPLSHILKGVGHAMDYLLGRGTDHLAQAMWRICAATALVESTGRPPASDG